MKIIIDIPEEDYNNIEPFLNGETIKGGVNLFKALEIIKNGTPLPKEHGRLLDEKVIFGMANKELNWVYDLTDMPDYITGLPAVIPAESEE